MPDQNNPRVVGFEVPPLKEAVDSVRDAPMVALLDQVPTREWVEMFEAEVERLRGKVGFARVSIEEDRVLFFGSRGDGRELAADIRALVNQTNTFRLNERFFARSAPAPFEPPDAPQAEVVLASPHVMPASDEPRHVLVVEDDEDLCAVACEVLEHAGWQAVAAHSAEEALVLLNGGLKPNAVLTDVDMQGPMNGVELAHHIHAHWLTIGLIIVSGRYSLTQAQIPVGSVFLSKPYQRRQLLAVLDLVTTLRSTT